MKKTYILDTNVIIDTPDAIDIFRNGVENRILIPYSVILELDRLKARNDLSHVISLISKNLLHDDKLEIIKKPGKIYHNNVDDNDILEEVLYFIEHEKENPIVISNDRLFRLRLKIENIETQEFIGSKLLKAESQSYTGILGVDENKLANCFYWDGEGKLIFNGKDEQKIIDYENTLWGVKPRHYTQNCTMELLLNEDIDILTIQSDPGIGKTFIALAGALSLVLQKPKKFNKILIFKPVMEIGEKIGFLPGNIDEKLAPYMKGIVDLLVKLHNVRPANPIFVDSKSDNFELNRKVIDIMHLGYVRGLNIDNTVVILDEGQNTSRYEMRSLLSRMGENVKCIITGSMTQIDNPYLNPTNNGLNWVVKKFMGADNYAHICLSGKKSRGPICDLVNSSGL